MLVDHNHNNIDPQRVSGQNHVDRMQHLLPFSKTFVHITVWLANHQSLTMNKLYRCSFEKKIIVVLNLKREHKTVNLLSVFIVLSVITLSGSRHVTNLC